MKNFIVPLIGIAVICGAVFLGVSSWRYFSSVTTRIDVVIPEPGVHCALASTSDGAAIDCWKVDK